MEAGTVQLLQDVEEQIKELEEKREKIIAQLQSLQNLFRQLTALERWDTWHNEYLINN